MTLNGRYVSRDELVAAWLRGQHARFWSRWDATARRHAADPRLQLNAAFALLVQHVADAAARGCAMSSAAVELTDADPPARLLIEAHKRKLRARLAELCQGSGAAEPGSLAEQLFLLIQGAYAATLVLGVQAPARNVERAAASLIDSRLGAEARISTGETNETHDARPQQPHPPAEDRKPPAPRGEAAEESAPRASAANDLVVKPESD